MGGADRTLDFFKLVNARKTANVPKQAAISPRNKELADFHSTSAQIQSVVFVAEKKLRRLAKMVERTRTMHTSNASSINPLIVSVKSDMSQASEAVSTLDKVVEHITVPGSQLREHCTRIVSLLENRTLLLTARFKEILKKRHAHMKSSSKRREIFGSDFAPLEQPLTFGLPGSSDAAEEGHPDGPGSDPVDIDLTLQTEQAQLIPDQDYYQQRSQAATNIESTIVELGGMFRTLSTMIESHGETIDTIAENVDDSLTHSEGAVGALEEAWKNAEGNKMLYLKIFLILMAFMAFFITFLA